jgi:hypothetical protein
MVKFEAQQSLSKQHDRKYLSATLNCTGRPNTAVERVLDLLNDTSTYYIIIASRHLSLIHKAPKTLRVIYKINDLRQLCKHRVIASSHCTDSSHVTSVAQPLIASKQETCIDGQQNNASDQIIRKSGFGGLGDACWPLVPKFTGSNPAEAVGFFRAKISPARLPSEGK